MNTAQLDWKEMPDLQEICLMALAIPGYLDRLLEPEAAETQSGKTSPPEQLA